MAYSRSALILRLRHLLIFSKSLNSASIRIKMASCEDAPCNELEKPIVATCKKHQILTMPYNTRLDTAVVAEWHKALFPNSSRELPKGPEFKSHSSHVYMVPRNLCHGRNAKPKTWSGLSELVGVK